MQPLPRGAETADDVGRVALDLVQHLAPGQVLACRGEPDPQGGQARGGPPSEFPPQAAGNVTADGGGEDRQTSQRDTILGLPCHPRPSSSVACRWRAGHVMPGMQEEEAERIDAGLPAALSRLSLIHI